jgi:hypothetical protein
MRSWHQPSDVGAEVSQVLPVVGGKYSDWAFRFTEHSIRKRMHVRRAHLRRNAGIAGRYFR